MHRHRQPELMDDPAVDAAEHRRALRALNRANRSLGFDRRLVKAATQAATSPHCRVLEIGVGGGGWLETAAHHANGNGTDNWTLYGLDVSHFAATEARARLRTTAGLICGDARRLPLADQSIDIAACSLLLHHFDPPDATALLSEARRIASTAVIVGDLDRHWLAWAATWLVTRLTSRSRIFHIDGPRSVRGAYRPKEAMQLALQAGMTGATIRRMFPFRWVLVWRRPGS